MKPVTVPLTIPATVWGRLASIADDREVTVADLITDAVANLIDVKASLPEPRVGNYRLQELDHELTLRRAERRAKRQEQETA